MNDETTPDPDACKSGSGFIIPGTHDAACDESADLQHCAHCGASLSPNSEFCQVCAVAVSGGEREPGHEGHTHEATPDGDS